ncbi:glycosyltransferase family 2 protein [Virgibacillus oceani]|uniref:Glycosyl transferase n=1 Tax=Virgibacillus oceani TaxID=1479511 RepID=A0A917HB22_9BACI|nr:glycosyltransferase [Virgibacillus oceani]GGG72252.1 glycosyl transferase [Virgibacillus oceani]
MLIITLVIFAVYVTLQLLYIFFPLFTVKNENNIKSAEKEKGISIIIPAYNEEKIILNCLIGIKNLNYSNFEAIIVNDGSTDKTLNLLIDHLQFEPTHRKLPAIKIPHQRVIEVYRSKLFPKFFLINKINGGKADALNAGIEYSAKEIVVTLDADSILEHKSLQAINASFQDYKVVAAGGMVQIIQGFQGNRVEPKTTFKKPGIIRYQILQYLTDFYLHKLIQTKFKSVIVISGAFGAFRKEVLFQVGGYRNTVGEDMDITLKIHQLIKTNRAYKKSKLVFIPQAQCYTECPETYKDLYNQRTRWNKGFFDCAMYYKSTFFKTLGLRLSFFFLVEYLMLSTLNAVTVLFIPVMLLINSNHFIIAVSLYTVIILLSIYQSIATFIVSSRFGLKYSISNYLKIALFIPIEMVSYRFLGVVFIISGMILYLKNKEKWTVSKRIGASSQLYNEQLTVQKDQAM